MKRRSVIKFMLRWAAMVMVPLVVLATCFVVFDPMLVFRWHPDMMPGGFLPNKGNVTVKSFNRYNPEMHYNAFIVGSSLSINHRLDDWKKHLPDDAVPYHFDTSNMNIEYAANVVEYISENADPRYLLFVMCGKSLAWGSGRTIPYILPAELQPSFYEKFGYYYDMFAYWCNWYVFEGWVMRHFFNDYAAGVSPDLVKSMRTRFAYFPDIGYDPIGNKEWSIEKEARLQAKNDRFLQNPAVADSIMQNEWMMVYDPIMTVDDYIHLTRMRSVLEKKNVDYYVLVPPSYDKGILNPADDAAMREIFGNRYVNLGYDQIEHTWNPYLWYDKVHYRPPLATKLMDRLYNDFANE